MFAPPKGLRPNVKVDKKKLEDRLNRQEDWLKRTGRLREYLPNEFEETVKQGRKTDKRMIEKSALIATLGTVLTLMLVFRIHPSHLRARIASLRARTRPPSP